MTKAGRKRLKYAIYALMIFLLFILQTTKGLGITVLEASPDFIIMLIPALALFEGPYAAGIFGFMAGILLSTSSPNIEGLEALWLCMIGIFCGYFGCMYLRRILPSALVVGASALLLRGLVSYIFYYGLAYGAPFWPVISVTLIKIVLSLPFGALLYELVRWLNVKLGEEDR